MKLKFSDGVEFNTDTKLHMEQRADGFYVVGQGMLIPVKDQDEAVAIMNKERINASVDV